MVTIDVLPEDVLIKIFGFYVIGYHHLNIIMVISGNQDMIKKILSWQTLVHVCRRWRDLVFESPRGLGLQLCCTTVTLAKETLDIWPALPLLIQCDVDETSADNVIDVLEHSDRICQMGLHFRTTSQIETIWTAMQVPFLELASLYLSYKDLPHGPVLPDSLLGGSAPRLRFLCLDSIPFPIVPNRLLSAAHLVHLWLLNIPHSAYVLPEAMANFLAMLTSLVQFLLGFESPQSRPDQQNRPLPPPTRTVLPALTSFSFKGDNEYLEELLARITTPRLHQLYTTFFNDIHFDIPELVQFITLTFEAPKDARVVFESRVAGVALQRFGQAPSFVDVAVKISCRVPDWQLSSLAQICTSCLPFLSATENLHINEGLKSQLDWEDAIENSEWLELLLPFTAVKDLYLSKQFTPRIAPALQEFARGGRTEVLPTLQNIFLEGFQPSEPVHEGIEQFISARQLSNGPIAISVWERDPE